VLVFAGPQRGAGGAWRSSVNIDSKGGTRGVRGQGHTLAHDDRVFCGRRGVKVTYLRMTTGFFTRFRATRGSPRAAARAAHLGAELTAEPDTVVCGRGDVVAIVGAIDDSEEFVARRWRRGIVPRRGDGSAVGAGAQTIRRSPRHADRRRCGGDRSTVFERGDKRGLAFLGPAVVANAASGFGHPLEEAGEILLVKRNSTGGTRQRRTRNPASPPRDGEQAHQHAIDHSAVKGRVGGNRAGAIQDEAGHEKRRLFEDGDRHQPAEAARIDGDDEEGELPDERRGEEKRSRITELHYRVRRTVQAARRRFRSTPRPCR
jgi:hypothetical protein